MSSENSPHENIEQTPNGRPRSASHLTTLDLNNQVDKLKDDLKEVNGKLHRFSQTLTDFTNSPTSSHAESTNPLTWSPVNMTTKMYAKTSGPNCLADRIYVKRESLLTELFKISHVRTIRNIFISIMIIFALQVVVNDLMEKGEIDLNFNLIQWAFGKSQIVFVTWIYMKFFTACVVYMAFHYWAKSRLGYLVGVSKKSDDPKSQDSNLNMYDLSWIVIFASYMTAFIIIPGYVVITNSLPPASAMIILMEQLRLVMKTYAFVRSNIPRALKNGKYLVEKDTSSLDESDSTINTAEERVLCPDFSKYLYFLFAPTLVYNDHYPRTTRVHWDVVFANLAQVFMCVIYTNYVFVRFCIPVFQDFNAEHVTIKSFARSILNCHLPGTLLLLIAFFAFLHCWMNAFAEMLCFGDRMFYKDWWNSTNFSSYYRTWNCVVHDFLYTYIYKDAHYILGKRYRVVSQFAIFFISAVFHEYVITLALGFFYPVLFIMFGGLGFIFMFIKPANNSNFWNFILWVFLQIGLGGVMCLYSIEWFARQNCSQAYESKLYDYLIPRSFSCGSNLDFNITQNSSILVNGSIKAEL